MRHSFQRSLSDAAGVGPSSTAANVARIGGAASVNAGQSAAAARLFEKVQVPPEAEEAAAAAAAAAAASSSGAGERSRLGSALGALGNALFFGSLGAGAFFGYYTLRYTSDQVQTMVEQTEAPENSFPGSQVWRAVMGWYVEQRKHIEHEVRKYSDPPSDRLLPDNPPHMRHVRTLVLDLDDTLVHSDWTRGRGWRTFKRPGADDFIRQLAQYYELVVFTSQLPTYADPILDRLDPNRYIAYRLYRDSTQYVGGRHCRDLTKLNRDPARVLLVSADPDAFHLQPENAIKLKKWKLEADDTTLLDLLPFLEAVVRTNVPDVRKVVASYEGEEDVTAAFRTRMQQLQAQQAAQKKQRRGLLGGLGG
ncbi:hypothetical protein WJX81_005792 [Elliptochloris bilobata]|uniref:Mitochondrial import inner membrane translocase subunit TIM50 n=1 Tax=Elliptochloris bilobata TaxID=381761 RepID=A0AAW1S2M5_9CHLO